MRSSARARDATKQRYRLLTVDCFASCTLRNVQSIRFEAEVLTETVQEAPLIT